MRIKVHNIQNIQEVSDSEVDAAFLLSKVQESIVLDVNETEKLKWLYQKQLVKSSELNENSIILELIWDSDEKKKFSQSFVETVL